MAFRDGVMLEYGFSGLENIVEVAFVTEYVIENDIQNNVRLKFELNFVCFWYCRSQVSQG